MNRNFYTNLWVFVENGENSRFIVNTSIYLLVGTILNIRNTFCYLTRK